MAETLLGELPVRVSRALTSEELPLRLPAGLALVSALAIVTIHDRLKPAGEFWPALAALGYSSFRQCA